jgi:hypothetical protein
VNRTLPFPWEFNQADYGDLYLMSRVTESQVQADIIQLLQFYKVDGVPIDAGGRRQRGRMIGAARAAGVNLAGVQNVKTGRAIPGGFADLEATLAPEGRALYVEVKAPLWINAAHKVIRAAGKASPDQLAFLLSKHKRGALVMVAWSTQDVVRWYGKFFEQNLKALR